MGLQKLKSSVHSVLVLCKKLHPVRVITAKYFHQESVRPSSLYPGQLLVMPCHGQVMHTYQGWNAGVSYRLQKLLTTLNGLAEGSIYAMKLLQGTLA